MAMHYNPSGSWYNYNFYGAPNQFPSPGAEFSRGQFNEEHLTEEDLSLDSRSQSPITSSSTNPAILQHVSQPAILNMNKGLCLQGYDPKSAKPIQ